MTTADPDGAEPSGTTAGFRTDPAVRRSWLERVLEVVRRLGSSGDLLEALQLIARGIVDVVEFDAVAVNIVTPGGDLTVEVAEGPPGVKVLLGSTSSREAWEEIFASCERWGQLLFSEADDSVEELSGLNTWTPHETEEQSAVGPDRWKPQYVLLAPMHDGSGALLGVLSVDMPRSGCVPDPEQRMVLEMFAAQAGSAIVEARRKSEARDRETLYRQVFAESPAAIAILNADLGVMDANSELLRMFGFSREALCGHPVGVFAEDGDAGRVTAHAEAVLDGRPGPVAISHRYVGADGQPRHARTAIRRFQGEGSGVQLICTIDDVTSDHEALAEQRRHAEQDPLTSVLNRRGGDRRLAAALSDPAPGQVAVISCDADGLKEVNDRFGHQVGDELLVDLARRLRHAVRTGDEVARMGGDEFVVIARVADVAEATAVASRCVEAVRRPFSLSCGACHVTLSVGVSLAPPGGGPIEPAALLAAADRALYQAKRLGKGRWYLAEPPAG